MRKELELPGNKLQRLLRKKMQEILDFISEEEQEEMPVIDEGLAEWKKQKSEARARMVAMQS
ncbi:MAG: hypothetical protein ACOCMZ_03425, partial [Acetivibrio ethanolgignens]